MALNDTIAYAKNKSKFYKNHLAHIDTLNNIEDLSCLPLMDAKCLTDNLNTIACVSQQSIERVTTIQSSGTIHPSKKMYFSKEDQELTMRFFGVGMSTFTKKEDCVLILLPSSTIGTVGDLLHKALRANAVPLIRYRTGDLTNWINSKCPCGTLLSTIAPIRGRLDNGIVLNNGKKIYKSFFDEVIYTY